MFLSVKKAHLMMDRRVHRFQAEYLQTGGRIYCGQHCANCCRLAVHATLPEAVEIVPFLIPEQLVSLDRYVEGLFDIAKNLGSMGQYLREHLVSEAKCPFLKDDTCGLYEHRPVSCRSLLSVKPPAWCAIDISSLDIWDKQLYMESLDAQAVAWPTHYLANTQAYGRQLEQKLLSNMSQQVGWSLGGNFPLLVWLEYHQDISRLTAGPAEDLIKNLAFAGRFLLDFKIGSI